MDLYAQGGAAIEVKYPPPWTLSNQGGTDLQWIRRKLEQGLESLAIQAVQTGCLKSKNVFDVLIDRHTIDGALSEFLQSQATGTGAPGVLGNNDTKQLWHHTLLYMQRASGVAGQPIHSRAIARIDEVLLAVLENEDTGPLDIVSSDGIGRKNIKSKYHFLPWQSSSMLLRIWYNYCWRAILFCLFLYKLISDVFARISYSFLGTRH